MTLLSMVMWLIMSQTPCRLHKIILSSINYALLLMVLTWFTAWGCFYRFFMINFFLRAPIRIILKPFCWLWTIIIIILKLWLRAISAIPYELKSLQSVQLVYSCSSHIHSIRKINVYHAWMMILHCIHVASYKLMMKIVCVTNS